MWPWWTATRVQGGLSILPRVFTRRDIDWYESIGWCGAGRSRDRQSRFRAAESPCRLVSSQLRGSVDTTDPAGYVDEVRANAGSCGCYWVATQGWMATRRFVPEPDDPAGVYQREFRGYGSRPASRDGSGDLLAGTPGSWVIYRIEFLGGCGFELSVPFPLPLFRVELFLAGRWAGGCIRS